MEVARQNGSHSNGHYGHSSSTDMGNIKGESMQRQIAHTGSKMVSFRRGLYLRMADEVEGEVFYFSGVARRERQSEMVGAALNQEFRQVLARMGYKLQ